MAGPIIFPLTSGPLATSGAYPQQSFAITPAQVTKLLNGEYYFNIHSNDIPNGEIRGQILIASCTTAGPVEVEASGGPFGATAYGTLKLAFDAINAGTHTGAINIEICASTSEGATPANLNSSFAGSASYTSMNIAK